jgi:hypothetical protein
LTLVGAAAVGQADTADRGRRLRWWQEVLTSLGIYFVYSVIRNVSEGTVGTAFAHAKQLIRWQGMIGLNIEETLQDHALRFRPLIIFMNYMYGSLHFVVTAGVVIWLFRRYPEAYPRWRNTLVVTTLLALCGFMFWPLMPPRLLPDSYGFVDTLAKYPTFWSFDSGGMNEVSNQYAAMPSLHFAWSTFCACALAPRAKRRWVQVAAISYPILTLCAIVLTGNHFILDAAGGALVFIAGYLIAHRLFPALRARF